MVKSKLGQEDFWTTEEGLDLRLEDPAEAVTWEIINDATILTGSEAGATTFEWVTEIGPTTCNYCDAQSGRRYRTGQFTPDIPAHPNCRCHWDVLFEMGRARG